MTKTDEHDLQSLALCLSIVGLQSEASAVSNVLQRLASHDARVTELLEANNREVERRRAAESALRGAMALLEDERARPVELLLFCPACLHQHVDAPDPAIGWTNPPHRSHLCASCGHVWRPADRPTTGVATIATKGAKDGGAHPCLTWETAVAAEAAARQRNNSGGTAAVSGRFIGLDRQPQPASQPMPACAVCGDTGVMATGAEFDDCRFCQPATPTDVTIADVLGRAASRPFPFTPLD